MYTYDDLHAKLAIDKHALDDELEQHPVLLHAVIEELARAVDTRDYAKKKMEETYAHVTLEIRTEGPPSGVKVTEDVIKQEAALNEEYKGAVQDYLDAKLDADNWTALREAFITRGHILRTLADLWIAGYYADMAVQGPSATTGIAEQRKRKLTARRQHQGAVATE